MNAQIVEEHNFPLGIIFALLAALSFSIMGLFIKIIGKDASAPMILFFRFGISLIFILPWAIKDARRFKLSNPLLHILRAFVGLLAFSCFYFAINEIPIADATLLLNSYPLIVPLVVLIILGVSTPFKVWLCVAIGFVGLLLVLRPGHELFQWASVIGLAGGVFASFSVVALRILTKTNRINLLLLTYFTINTLVSGILTPFFWRSIDLKDGLLLFGVGISGVIYQKFLAHSFAVAPVRYMSPLLFMAVIVGGIFDWLFWNRTPTLMFIIGVAIVIGGATLTILVGKPKKNISTEKKQ